MPNLNQFDESVNALESEVEKLKKISEVYQQVSDVVGKCEAAFGNINDSCAALTELTKNISQKIEDFSQSEIQFHNTLTSDMESRLNEIREANDHHYTNMANVLDVKLDNNKGEIIRLIEHERSEIRNMIDAQSQQLNQRIDGINAQLSAQGKVIKSIKTIVLVFGIVAIVFLIVSSILPFVVGKA